MASTAALLGLHSRPELPPNHPLSPTYLALHSSPTSSLRWAETSMIYFVITFNISVLQVTISCRLLVGGSYRTKTWWATTGSPSKSWCSFLPWRWVNRRQKIFVSCEPKIFWLVLSVILVTRWQIWTTWTASVLTILFKHHIKMLPDISTAGVTIKYESHPKNRTKPGY